MPEPFSVAGLAKEPNDEAIAPGSRYCAALPCLSRTTYSGALGDITLQAQFPRMTTRWGAAMSVAMTNCGEAGWLSDRGGYRYDRIDPETGWAVAGDASVF